MPLYEHQRKILEEDPKRTGLFLGTGSGKTRLALLLSEPPVMVIAPKTQVQDRNWEREVEKLGLDTELTVVSKETFRRDHLSLPPCRTLLADESHTLCGVEPRTVQRNYVRYPKTSQLFAAVSDYIGRCRPERLYLLSATPDRSPMAVWGAARLLGYDWDFYRFRERFYRKATVGRHDVWLVRKDRATKDDLGEVVRRLGHTGRLEDWFDVPEQTFRTDFVELTAEQRKAVRELREDFPDPGVFAGKADQVENGALRGDGYEADRTFRSRKTDRILDYAAEFPRLLVFARYTLQIAAMKEALEGEGYRVLTLDGSTGDKGAVIAEANAAEACVVIAQSQVSAGYELPEYPCTVFASLSGSLVDLVQAQGRTLRANALKKNLYVYLVARGGVDERRYESNVIHKLDFHEAIYES